VAATYNNNMRMSPTAVFRKTSAQGVTKNTTKFMPLLLA